MTKSTWLWYVGIVLIMFGGACMGNIATPPIPLWPLLGIVVLSAGFIVQGFSRSEYRIYENRWPRKTPAQRRPVLILTVSECRGITDEQPVPEFVQITGDLDADLQQLAENKRQTGGQGPIWNWEMPLRAVHHHVRDNGPLKRLVLVCSPESVVQVHLLIEKVFRKYRELDHVDVDVLLGRDGSLKRWGKDEAALARHNGFDLSDFEVLTAAYECILRDLRGDETRLRQIQVDFTGGPKPASVVAATITLDNRMSNQYVSTNPNDRTADRWEYDVVGYDFVEPPRD